MKPETTSDTAAAGGNLITGRSAFLSLLREEGVDRLFGNPGTTELPIMHALSSEPDMGYVLGLQEGIVVAMADGYARASGRLAACNVHVAPGLGNAMGSLYNAKFRGSPVLVTAGQQEIGHGLAEPLLYDPLVPIAEPLVKRAGRGRAERGAGPDRGPRRPQLDREAQDIEAAASARPLASGHRAGPATELLRVTGETGGAEAAPPQAPSAARKRRCASRCASGSGNPQSIERKVMWVAPAASQVRASSAQRFGSSPCACTVASIRSPPGRVPPRGQNRETPRSRPAPRHRRGCGGS